MRTDPRCGPCLLNRVLYEAELSTKDNKKVLEAVRAGAEFLGKGMREGADAIDISTGIHRLAYDILGDDDPYREMKALSNRIAASLLPEARRRIQALPEKGRFRAAVLASIIGNNFDFGVQGHEVDTSDFGRFFDEMSAQGLGIDDTDDIKALAAHGDVVYLADNCGEIYFDELVIDQLKEMKARVTLVVRGGPILTDATMEDVIAMGLDMKADRVMTTGSNAIGVDIRKAPAGLLDAMAGASVIISKGMANFESLGEKGYHPIAYLLRAKCEPVAMAIGAKKGMNVARLVA